MKKTLLAIAIITANLAVAAPDAPWRIQKAAAASWLSILCNDHFNIEHGAQQWLGNQDLMVLCVRTTLQCKWTETYSEVRLKKEQISFVDQAGTAYKLVGKLDPANQLETAWAELKTGGRVAEHGSNSPIYTYLPIFLVPKSVTAGTLHLGDKTVKVSVPQPKSVPSPAKTISLKVVSAKLMDEAPTKQRLGKEEYSGTIRNPFGRLLRVEYQFKPTQFFNESDNYNYDTSHLTIITDKGVVAPTCGIDFMGDVLTTTHNIGKNSQPSTSAIYFPVPASLKSFRVLYHNQPVTTAISTFTR